MLGFKKKGKEFLPQVAAWTPTIELEIEKLNDLEIDQIVEIKFEAHNRAYKKLLLHSVEDSAKANGFKIRSKWVNGSLIVWRYPKNK